MVGDSRRNRVRVNFTFELSITFFTQTIPVVAPNTVGILCWWKSMMHLALPLCSRTTQYPSLLLCTNRKQGRLMAWGSGPSGELGLGPNVLERRTPCFIRGLGKVAVRIVVAGSSHALCVTLEGTVGLTRTRVDTNLGARRDGRRKEQSSKGTQS